MHWRILLLPQAIHFTCSPGYAVVKLDDHLGNASFDDQIGVTITRLSAFLIFGAIPERVKLGKRRIFSPLAGFC